MFWIYKTDTVNHFATILNITWKTRPLTWKNTKLYSLLWRQEVLVHLPFITSETGVAGNTIWKGFDQLCPFINNWMGRGANNRSNNTCPALFQVANEDKWRTQIIFGVWSQRDHFTATWVQSYGTVQSANLALAS